MSQRDLIRTLEEHALNAWPALQQLFYDGWIMRFANGYTKRANSVNPIYRSTLPLQPKIERCIALYQTQHLPPIFRLTPLAGPEIDEALVQLGFDQQSLTSVQLLDLAPISTPQSNAPSQSQAGVVGQGEVSAWNRPTLSFDLATIEVQPAATFQAWSSFSLEWEAHFARLHGHPIQQAAHQAILRRIIPAQCFAVLRFQEQVVACGLGVQEGAYVGLFDIIVDKAWRRQGFAQVLMAGILDWGRQNGATRAYLQVEINNTQALNLYRKLGFVEVYQYWYRVSL